MILEKWKEKLPEKTQRLSGRLSSPAGKEILVYPKEYKAAAMSKNQEMRYEVKDLDLTSKEFKYHSSCYKEFTRGYSEKCRTDTNSAKSTYEETSPNKRTFDIKAVEEFI